MTTQDVRPSSADNTLFLTAPFVGRQREFECIWKQYEIAEGGSARVVVMVGEPGIGKTRFLDEIATRALHEGATVLRGSTTESEGMPPYLPFLEALGQYIRKTSLNELRAQIGVTAQQLASIFPELANRFGELPVSNQLPPEQARLRLYEAIGTFLEAISVPQVLVLGIDDLHWADAASLDLLCYIARQQATAKLLVLCTCREGEIGKNHVLDRALHQLTRQRVLTTIEINPLSAEEIETLAVSYLGNPIHPRVISLLQDQSEGNPFFAEEILRYWMETDALAQSDGAWRAIASLERTLPASIVGALRQRFARFSTALVDYLRVAAIIAHTFDVSLLAAVQKQDVESVEEIILEAVHARLLRIEHTGLFTFSHDKIRETLYAEVSASRRRRLHGEIGQILETRYNQQSKTTVFRLAELAFHFSRSDDRERGVKYSQQAAEQALRSFATDEAIVHYRTALHLLEQDDDRRGSLLLDLGRAALLLDNDEEAETAYTEALDWFMQRGEQESAAQAAQGMGLVQWRMESLEAARATMEYALSLLEKKSCAETVQVQVNLSTLLTIYLDQQREGNDYAEQARMIAQSLGDSTLEAATTRAVAGKFYTSSNHITEALVLLERSLAFAEASDDPGEAAECCNYLAVAYYRIAQVKRSHEIHQRRMQLIEGYRYPYHLRYSYSWSAFLFSSQGQWREAELAIEQAQSLAYQLFSPAPLAFVHQISGFLAYQQEDYVTAERELLVARTGKPRDPTGIVCEGLLGLVQVALGKNEEAATSMFELEALLIKVSVDSMQVIPIMICLALMALTLDDRERIAHLYPKLLAFRGQLYWFLVDRVLGEMALRLEEWEAAVLHLESAEVAAKRERLRLELAHVLVAQANYLVTHEGKGSTTQAATRLKQALAIFEELKLFDAVRRVQLQTRKLSDQAEKAIRQPFPAGLTSSEAKVLQLVVKGKSNRQIAQELGLSEKTVANHLTHIYSKTTSENRAAATAFAIRHKLV